jgi:hypothetical protein
MKHAGSVTQSVACVSSTSKFPFHEIRVEERRIDVLTCGSTANPVAKGTTYGMIKKCMHMVGFGGL